MSEKFVTVDGITLHYLLNGTAAGIPLVFINSLGTDLRIWEQVIPYFTNRFAIIRYDKRGHGLSDAPPAPYTLADHVNDLAGLLTHLKVENAILVGISVGGMIAQAYAARYPQRTRALVLCDTAAKIGTADYWNERIQVVTENGLESIAEMLLARWFAPEFRVQHPADYRGYSNMLTRTPVTGYVGTCASLRDADLREVVGTIQAKTLVLCGAQDLATPPDLARELAERLPHGRLVLIENAGHLPCIEQPAAMATYIAQFLQDV